MPGVLYFSMDCGKMRHEAFPPMGAIPFDPGRRSSPFFSAFSAARTFHTDILARYLL